MKIAILILIYNSKLVESKTINAILNSNLSFSEVRLIIWNNGPKKLENKDISNLNNKGLNVSIIETLENRAISKIYNEFLTMCDVERYVFLDHDSSLSDNYLSTVLNSEYEIGVPIIYVDGIPRSPTINGNFVSDSHQQNKMLISIGSGLILSRNAKKSLEAKLAHVFDERYYLYGVDTTFFIRVNDCGLSNLIRIIPGFEHSLSRFEAETTEISDFRIKERSYDLGLTLKYYPSYYFVSAFFKVLIKKLLGQKTLSVKDIYISFVSGKHYRLDN